MLACSYQAPSTIRAAGWPRKIEAVYGRAMGVAVQQQGDAVGPHRAFDGRLIDVHDVVALGRNLGCGQLPQVARDLAALGERLGEEVALPSR